ncbi:hypothetical protein E3A20_23430 [Planctomyces bekefii]|uniref:GDP-mannose pyrophosphatase n=1 Tax=Planctomyces bekefii TaxID=1653850 RepID=A0A5C6M2L9_9PLAN|nr:hypothetical protein E3A20_23430 [Planctomyces bekefii]
MIKPWKIVDECVVRAGAYRKVRDITFELPDGRREIFTVKHEGHPVCVLALTVDEMVILARQFRPGPNRVLDELPGGGPEPGETNVAAAARELLEETGYQAGEMLSLGFPLECAYSDVRREAFLALGCVKIGEPELDPNEFIEPVLKTIPEFVRQLALGDCTDPEVGWMGLYRLGKVKL